MRSASSSAWSSIRATSLATSMGIPFPPMHRGLGGYGTYPDLSSGDPEAATLYLRRSDVVETDRAGEWPVPFWSETVRRVVVE